VPLTPTRAQRPTKPGTAKKLRPEVAAGLAWLVKAQQADGSWQTGMGTNSTAILVTTSYCGLALMAAGPQYRRQVDAAAGFVAANLFRGTLPGAPAHLDQSNWSVAIGGLFLCEYYAGWKKRRPGARSRDMERLLNALVKEAVGRMEPSGGWGHTKRVKNPLGYLELEIVSNWMLATLGACQRLGVEVPEEEVGKALKFVAECCNEGSGGVGYSPRPGWKGFGCPCRTGGAIFAFAILGKENDPLYPRMVEFWRARSPGESDGGHGSVAMGLLSSALAARQLGEGEWQGFEEKFFPKVLALARRGGAFKEMEGSTPQSKANEDRMAGDAYNTGIYLLLLQLDRGNLTYLGRPQGPMPAPAKPARRP
jgi:hypothetical protein